MKWNEGQIIGVIKIWSRNKREDEEESDKPIMCKVTFCNFNRIWCQKKYKNNTPSLNSTTTLIFPPNSESYIQQTQYLGSWAYA